MALARSPERRVRDTLWMKEDRRRNREKYLRIERSSRAKAKIRLGVEGWKKRSKSYNLKKYSLSLIAFENLLASQKNSCAICYGSPGNKNGFHVDHNHVTGQVRGLLCHTCNQGMIAVDRVSDWFEKAKQYAAKDRRA